jgi:hypothetical protein
MVDPLSIAGLAISIFDQLLKLGERTCQLLADAKTFDDVSRISSPDSPRCLTKSWDFLRSSHVEGQGVF